MKFLISLLVFVNLASAAPVPKPATVKQQVERLRLEGSWVLAVPDVTQEKSELKIEIASAITKEGDSEFQAIENVDQMAKDNQPRIPTAISVTKGSDGKFEITLTLQKEALRTVINVDGNAVTETFKNITFEIESVENNTIFFKRPNKKTLPKEMKLEKVGK